MSDTKCKSPVYFVKILVLIYAVDATHLPALSDYNCTQITKTRNATLGWPYLVECKDVEQNLTGQKRCIIFDGTGSDVLYNETWTITKSTHILPDITEHNHTVYIAVISLQTTSCVLLNLTLKHTRFSRKNCEDANQDMVPDQTKIQVPYNIHCADTHFCAIVDSQTSFTLSRNRTFWIDRSWKILEANAEVPLPSELSRKYPFKVQWLYNCKKKLPKGLDIQKSTKYWSTLHFPKIQAIHAGKYTCAIIYKNQTRYFYQDKLCVKYQGRKVHTTQITCRKYSGEVARLDGSQTARLLCDVSVSEVVQEIGSIEVTWRKAYPRKNVSNIICENFGGHEHSRNKTISCKCQLNLMCADDPDFIKQHNGTPVTLQLSLEVSNVTYRKLGNYIVELRLPNGQKFEDMVELLYNPNNTLQETASTIAVLFAIILLLLIFLAILYYFRLYLCLIKKRCCGAYVSERKVYDVVLSYHFSVNDDLYAQEQTREVVTHVNKALETLGYKVYDEHKHGTPGARTRTTLSAIHNSHRFLVILTANYIKNDWRVFQMQQILSDSLLCLLMISSVITT